jgi:hypothetical protein
MNTTHFVLKAAVLAMLAHGSAMAQAQTGAGSATLLSSDPPLAVEAHAPPRRDDSLRATSSERDLRPVQGLYVRGGLGFGALGNNVIDTTTTDAVDPPEGTTTGMGTASEIMIGAAVSSEWVLGGGLWSSLVFVTDYRQVHGPEIPEGLQHPESLTLGGFVADWSFARKLGLHAQAGIGLAVLTSQRFATNAIGDVEVDGSTAALGPGITMGLGADFWIAERWALGAMARVSAAAAFEKLDGHHYAHGLVTPSLLMTVCYNE